MSTATHAILPAGASEARARWISLQQRCASSGAFDDFDFVKGLAATQHLACDVLMTRFGGTDALAIMLPHRSLGPFREVLLPRFCPTSPALVAPEMMSGEHPAVSAAALNFVLTRFHRVGLHIASPLVSVLSDAAWRSTPLYTYDFDLQALSDDVTAGWSAGTRRLFRKHAAKYLIEQDDAHARTAVELCAEGYRRSGRPLPVSIEQMALFARRPPGAVRTRSFVAKARSSGEVHAGLVVLTHRDTAFYWIAGSIPGPSMTVLVGNVLQALREAGIRHFDFVGANTPTIAEFKRRFGPELREYRRISASRSRMLDFLLASRGRLRRFVAR